MPSIPWLRQKGESVPISQVSDNVPEANEGMYKGILKTTSPTLLALSAFTVGSVTTLAATATYLRFGRRLQNGGWITPKIFKQKRWIKGIVTTVGDGDNFRLYHVPTLGGHIPFRWLRRIPSTPRELRHKTIHIRIAGVDAPEASHFGRPAQPYAVESIEWLRGMILGKTVYCQLLQRDQYSRVVANVFLAPRFFPGFLVAGKNIALEMLRAGWATTYEQAGAEYGESGKDEFLRIEAEAKAARRGMWKNGTKIETPSEYKRRHAAKEDAGDQDEAMEADMPQKSWTRRLLRW